MKHSLLLSTTALGLALAFASCQKNKDCDRKDDDNIDFTEASQADALFTEISTAVDEAAATTTGLSKTAGTCPSVSVDSSQGWPRRVTLTFDSTCTGPNGGTRMGTLVAWISGPYYQQGTTVTIRPYNFYVNGRHLEGVRHVTNNGLNGDGNPTWSINVDSGLVTWADGSTRTWTSSRTREQVAGQNTQSSLDNVYHITGTASGTGRNGQAYSATILTPLEVAVGCRWPRSGSMQVTKNGKTGTVDFGSGNCDSQATVTGPKGNSKSITLPW